MSVKIFGIREDGGQDLIGLAPAPKILLRYSVALNGQLKDYGRAMVTDTTPMQEGLPIWTVYNNPADWPGWYVARLSVNDQQRGNLLLYRDLHALREEMMKRGLTCLTRHPTDDPVIVETWL